MKNIVVFGDRLQVNVFYTFQEGTLVPSSSTRHKVRFDTFQDLFTQGLIHDMCTGFKDGYNAVQWMSDNDVTNSVSSLQAQLDIWQVHPLFQALSASSV